MLNISRRLLNGFNPFKSQNPIIQRYKSMKPQQETICALSTAPGKAAIAIIRVTGSDSKYVLTRILKDHKLPEPRMAMYKYIADPKTRTVIDGGIAIWLPGPKSFTGEDSFELHVHGSKAVISYVIRVLVNFSNVRLAKPGEFIRRAYFNSKVSLPQVEGFADLLNAETEAQRKQAMQHSQGALHKIYEIWIQRLMHVVINFEADINFGESDQVSPNIENSVKQMKLLHEEILGYISRSKRGIITREGIKIVVFGAPNVGKSSLVNAISHKNPSIVDAKPGTTRDILDVPLDIKGFACNLYDTAGLRSDGTDKVENEGMRRCRDAIKTANLCIFVVPFGEYVLWRRSHEVHSYNPVDFIKDHIRNCGLHITYNERARTICELFNNETLIVFNKIDEADELRCSLQAYLSLMPSSIQYVSAKNDIRICTLIHAIADKLQIITDNASEDPKVAHTRHCEHLKAAVSLIDRFICRYESGFHDMAIMVNDLGSAANQIATINGKKNNDDYVLDAIFSTFCIGK